MDFNPIGKPDNFLIKMTPDVLPQPDAVLVHGITPQKTLIDGISEAEFCKYLTSQVCTEGTIMVGYNNLRFDNDFIRFTLWRNFYDAYEWSWKNDCGIWDLLDVTRMTRALRPEGIKWPFNSDGKPSNKLEHLSAVNKLDHVDAHDALSDVHAAVALAELLKQKQPKLFEYLLNIRGKREVMPFVASGKPFVYTSGRYPSEFNKTTVAVMVAENPDKSGALVYDLRIDPDEFKDLSASDLAKRWSARGEEVPYFPVKELKYNKCPAIAPVAVLDKEDGYEKIKLHKGLVRDHLKKLAQAKSFGDKLIEAQEAMWPKRQTGLVDDPLQVDGQLYDGFVSDEDKAKMSVVRAAEPDKLSDLSLNFKDGRLTLLLPLYKARNFPKYLTEEERAEWENFRRRKLVDSGAADKFFKRLEELATTPGLDGDKQYLLEELNLYGQSSIPEQPRT